MGSIVPHKLTKRPSKQSLAFDRQKSSENLDADSISSSTRGGPSGVAVNRVLRRLGRGATPSRSMYGDNSSTGSLMSDSTHSSDQLISPPPYVSNPPGSSAHISRHAGSEEPPYATGYRRNSYPHDSRRYLSYLEANRPREPSRAHSYRDLAILPTQRVMRYVLLFRGEDSFHCPTAPVYRSSHRSPPDLLADTSDTCCNRPVVEAALAAATRIAEKCDGAQKNTAFARLD